MHKLADSLERPERIERPKVRRATDSELHARFSPLCDTWCREGTMAVRNLATSLGVSYDALYALAVGWDGEVWTFPERNHHGQIVGVNRRFPNGKKVCVVGSRRGLTYASGWHEDRPGPIFLVEGGSDVAAGLTLGLCVVGRPSNLGGVDCLVRLLRGHDRRIVLLAERDAKDRVTSAAIHDPACQCCGQCFPGMFGAVETANKLMTGLRRLVDWTFLPDGAKDLRVWLKWEGANPGNQSAMRRLRISLIERTRNVIHV